MFNEGYTKIQILKKALDGSWARHNAISNNIANVNTPGYKRINVEFEEKLRRAIEGSKLSLYATNKGHISNLGNINQLDPDFSVEKSYSTRKDKNNVNIDVENAELAKNTILYDALIRQISDEFNKIKMVLNEGGK